ncbi:hypothetical protein AB4Z48_12970 [Cupriavidus sp. 2TAF22]
MVFYICVFVAGIADNADDVFQPLPPGPGVDARMAKTSRPDAGACAICRP